MQVGFQNYSTFYNTFKRLTGVSPERYARESAQQRKNRTKYSLKFRKF